MSKTTRIRTGMYSVLSVFVACLLLACLYGWTSARTSAQQLRELDSLTMEQLDKVNNAATWISRASANSHTAMLDRVNGDAAKAEKGTALALERLDIARRLITDMLASANDPKLRGQIEAMLKAFDARSRPAVPVTYRATFASAMAPRMPAPPSPIRARSSPTRSTPVSTRPSPPPKAGCCRQNSAPWY